MFRLNRQTQRPVAGPLGHVREARQAPCLHQVMGAGPSDAARVKAILRIGHASRRTRPQACMQGPLDRVPDDFPASYAERIMTDERLGWRPHHSLEALIDQFAPFAAEAEDRRWQRRHLTRLMSGDFNRLRGMGLERFVARRCADLDPGDLARLAAWMNRDGNHPNPGGWFDQIQDRLPDSFKADVLPGLRRVPPSP